MQTHLQFGRQSVRLLEPDLAAIALHGTIDEEEMRWLVETLSTHCVEQPHCRMLIDLRGFTNMTPGARRFIARHGDNRPSSLAYVGASFTARVLTALVFRAVQLLCPRDIAYEFFDDEAAAQAWLEGQRRSAG